MSVLHVAAGTYSHCVQGLEATAPGDAPPGKLNFQARYSYEAHAGALTAITATATTLVTGSTDEMIKIYDLNKQVEVGTLVHHEGTVTALAFFGSTHLLSTGEDGRVCIWDTRSWQLLKELLGHQGAVHALGIHPSGRLGLTVGADKTLRVWNLVKGRSAYITNLKDEAHVVRWSPSGSSYVIVFEKRIEIFATATGELSTTIAVDHRVLEVVFLAVWCQAYFERVLFASI